MTNKFILKIKNKYRNKKSISTFLIKIFIFPFKFILHKIKILKKWILGRLFELIKKNKIIYKELIFSFDNPYFLTKEKDHLLFGYKLFEENQILFAEKYINKNLPLIEFGGCMGVVACITNKLIKNKHIVVEANPYIIPVLEQNKKINSCNFSIINKAVGYKNIIDYYVSRNPVDGGLYKKTPQIVSIQTITLGELTKNLKRVNLIVDIEGTETTLIDNEINLISEKVSVLIIEFHPKITGEIEIKKIISKLEESGLQCIESIGNDSVFINSKI